MFKMLLSAYARDVLTDRDSSTGKCFMCSQLQIVQGLLQITSDHSKNIYVPLKPNDTKINRCWSNINTLS